MGVCVCVRDVRERNREIYRERNREIYRERNREIYGERDRERERQITFKHDLYNLLLYGIRIHTTTYAKTTLQ